MVLLDASIMLPASSAFRLHLRCSLFKEGKQMETTCNNAEENMQIPWKE